MKKESRNGIRTIERGKMSRREFLGTTAAVAAAGATALLLPEGTAQGAVPLGMVDTSAYKKKPPWTVGRSGMGETNTWQILYTNVMAYGFEEKHKGLFKKVRYVQAMWNPAKQINDMEDLITRNVDLIFLTPATEAALGGPVEKAMNRGIPVVLHAAKARTNKYVTYMDRDNPLAGFQYGEWMAKQLGGQGNVVVFMGLAGNTYAEDVLRGVRNSLQSHKGMKEVGLAWASWSPVKAKKAMEAFLQKHPKIDGVISDGGQMGVGCVDAFLDAKKPIPPITADDTNLWLRRAKKHNIKFLSVGGGADQGLQVVDVGVKVLRGEPIPKTILKEAVTFEQDELDKYLRPDLDDRYWALNPLPESWRKRLYAKK